MRVFRAVELLIEKIKKDYSDDISLVVIMGSHLYNDTHAKSDLDMYFIPKTPKGFNLGFVFIIDGIGFDFWPIPWERIDRIASWDERIVSILTEGQVEYYGTEEDLAKFNLYKQRALDVSNKGHFIWKAREKINSSFMQYFEVEKSETLSEMRKNGIKLIYSVTEALSLLNRIPIKRGRGKLLSEIMSMPLIPEGFEKFYKVLFDSEDLHEIKKSLVNLFQNTRYLIKKEETKDLLGSFKNEAAGFYEEQSV